MKCEDCKYCQLDLATGVRNCNKYAPRASVEQPRGDCPMDSDFSRTLWPIVLKTDWCGEFERKCGISWSHTIWSARLQSIFRYYGIQSFEQLTNYTEADLLGMKRFGMMCLTEVTEELSKHGLSLLNNQ